MPNRMPVIALAILTVVLVACNGQPSAVRAVVGKVAAASTWGNSAVSEIKFRLTIRNTTPTAMHLSPTDFTYEADSPVVPAVVAGSGPALNESRCDGPTEPGRVLTCRLALAWDDYYAASAVLPGTLSWRDSSGRSHELSAGSARVTQWQEDAFEPPL